MGVYSLWNSIVRLSCAGGAFLAVLHHAVRARWTVGSKLCSERKCDQCPVEDLCTKTKGITFKENIVVWESVQLKTADARLGYGKARSGWTFNYSVMCWCELKA